MASNSQAVMLQTFENYETILMDLFRQVAKKVKSKLAGSVAFLEQLAGAAVEIGKKIGNKAIAKVGGMIGQLVGAVDGLPALIKRALKMVRKVLVVLRSKLDPAAMGKRVIALSKKFFRVFREVIEAVLSVYDAIDPIDKVLSVINAAKMMLKMMFAWIVGVTGAASALKRSKMVIKKFQRRLVKLMKELMRMPRKIRQLAAG